MKKHFEKDLPEGYTEVFHMNAKDKKTGLLFTLFSLILALIPLAITFPIYFCIKKLPPIDLTLYCLSLLGFCFSMILYVICHELVHGIAYKILTKQKLTFGMSWSCAYCGVPNIYVYRRASIIALLAPFTLFSLIFIGLLVWFYSFNGWLYVGMAVLFAVHFGGCVGDLFMFFLFLFKYKDKTILMKDTGPEQFLYQKGIEVL
ncbi:MAG: DUF3267 domain-containing protein [Anaeroplasmataceae bacterium]|nr:DUF3267 domain-containing protein [Anaeroplasmataceae bacterium]